MSCLVLSGLEQDRKFSNEKVLISPKNEAWKNEPKLYTAHGEDLSLIDKKWVLTPHFPSWQGDCANGNPPYVCFLNNFTIERSASAQLMFWQC